ncbi:MAG TPA: hypothetical protein VJP06_00340, partial [Thermoplasmata archaeon]|nr:hypothetical protein [Thermoplasmata archaeon]
NDPLNQIRAPQIVRAGTGPETLACDASGICRYGDYFGAARDPTDPLIIWAAGEYGTSSGWATFIAGMSAIVRLAASYSVDGAGTGYVAPVLSYVKDGVTLTATLATTPTAYQVDAESVWSVTRVLNGSTATERWATNDTTSGNATASSSLTFVYSHQFLASFAYHVTGGGLAYTGPSVSYQRFAVRLSIGANASDWADSGSTYGFPMLLGGSNGSERWRADPMAVNGTVAAAGSIDVAYVHQAFVRFQIDGPAGVSISTPTGWYDVGSSVTPTANSPPGWAPGEWIGAGPGAYSGTLGSPTITVIGPFSETLVFFPGLTITAGSGGSVSFSYSGGSGIVGSASSETIHVRPGTVVTITVHPSDAYVFKQWSGAVSGTQSNVTVTVSTPTQVSADFGPKQATPPSSLDSGIAFGIAVVALSVIVLVRRRRRRAPPSLPPPPPPPPPR